MTGGRLKGPAQSVKARRDVVMPRCDEPVGVEDEETSFGQVQFGAFEGQTAQAEWRARRQLREVDGTE